MKTQVNKWLRWGAAGAFGLMLTLNVMVGLEFEKDKVVPTLTLVELGNQANAQSESDDGGNEITYYTRYTSCANAANPAARCRAEVTRCSLDGSTSCQASDQKFCDEVCAKYT